MQKSLVLIGNTNHCKVAGTSDITGITPALGIRDPDDGVVKDPAALASVSQQMFSGTYSSQALDSPHGARNIAVDQLPSLAKVCGGVELHNNIRC